MAKTTGHYVTTATAGEQFKAFVPDPLPAQSALNLKARHFELMEKANWALGRLDGVAAMLRHCGERNPGGVGKLRTLGRRPW